MKAARLWIFFSFIVSCQTTNPKVVEKSSVPEELDNTQHLIDVPKQFWSPDQRKISAIYNYLVGEYTLLKGHVQTSHDAFAKAYSLDPNPFLGGKSILTMAKLGHTDTALAESKKMVLLHPKDPYLRFLHGQILVRAGNFKEAKKQLERSLDLNGTYIPSYHALIDLHILQNQLQDALVIAKEMIQKIPSAVMGWSKLSRIYLMLKRNKEALKPAKTAFDMQSSNPVLVMIYAYTLELNGFSSEAIDMYERLYQSNSTNEQFIRHLASLYRQLGGLQKALTLLNELAKRSPRISIGVNIQRVIILWELKENEKANAILLRLLEEHPSAARLIYLTALSEERLGKYEKAVSRYHSLREDEELDVLARFRLAIIYQQQDAPELAKKEMQYVVASKKTKWEFFVFLADIHGKQKNYISALRVVLQGLGKHPKSIPLIFMKGVYQEKNGDIAGCMKTMRRVIELDPNHSGAYNYLGYLLVEQNTNLSEALQLILTALKLRPNNGYYLDSLAWAYYRLGEYDKAHINILKALHLHPEEATILEHYADILLKLNQPKKGLLIYQKALQYFSDRRDKKRIKDKIINLEKNS